MKQHKARLVAQGFLQKHGVDYNETFCPVVRFESVRTVIALAAKHDLKLHQLDITTAFLNGELNEDIYMKQPERFEVKGKEHLVCKLNRSLYGLKQSPRCWNEALNSQLKKMYFKQLENDPCIYTLTLGGEIYIAAVYVDDIILASKSSTHIQEFIKSISERIWENSITSWVSKLLIQGQWTTSIYSRSVGFNGFNNLCTHISEPIKPNIHFNIK